MLCADLTMQFIINFTGSLASLASTRASPPPALQRAQGCPTRVANCERVNCCEYACGVQCSAGALSTPPHPLPLHCCRRRCCSPSCGRPFGTQSSSGSQARSAARGAGPGRARRARASCCEREQHPTPRAEAHPWRRGRARGTPGSPLQAASGPICAGLPLWLEFPPARPQRPHLPAHLYSSAPCPPSLA